jgi:SPP1 gp7 family putative phage head morphogenesis protein
MIMFDFSLKPEEALSYLQGKGYKLSFNYDEVKRDQHNKAFTVAKVTRLDLLTDIHNSLISAMEEGTPFEQWKRDLKPTLKQHGWLGETEAADPKTGEVKTINVNSRRLSTIYYTNMRTSYAKGRYDQMSALPDAVYWRYVAILDSVTRPAHRALHGMIRHRSDPFWTQNYPPNSWGCRCSVRAYQKEQLETNGWKITPESTPLPAGYKPHPNWSYNVGATAKVGSLEKLQLDSSVENLPQITADKTMAELTDAELKAKFFKDMGIKPGGTFVDVIGDPTVLDDNLFSTGGGFSKIKKDKRHLYVAEFARLIKDPDEMYIELEKLKQPSGSYLKETHRLVKKYFKYYTNEKGGKSALVAMFEYQKNKTQGATLYFIKNAETVERKRFEKLIYSKDK